MFGLYFNLDWAPELHTQCQLPGALRRAGYTTPLCFRFWVFSPRVWGVSSIKTRTFPPSKPLPQIQPKLILLGDAKFTLGPKSKNNLFKNMPITPWKTFRGSIISLQILWWEGNFLLSNDMARTGCSCIGSKGGSRAVPLPGLLVWVPLLVLCWATSPSLFFYFLLSSRVHVLVQGSRWSLLNRHGLLAKPAWIEESRKTWPLSSSSWSPVTRRGIRFAQLSRRGEEWGQYTEDARGKNIFTIIKKKKVLAKIRIELSQTSEVRYTPPSPKFIYNANLHRVLEYSGERTWTVEKLGVQT